MPLGKPQAPPEKTSSFKKKKKIFYSSAIFAFQDSDLDPSKSTWIPRSSIEERKLRTSRRVTTVLIRQEI